MAVCFPSSNQVCQQVETVSVTQPTTQVINDNTVQSNPYFDSINNMSYWTYKVIPLCIASPFITISEVYIPIYENISAEMLTVSEKILSCGRFEDVAYDFTSPTGITPPTGFKYVRIVISGRYTNGVTALYRLNILGNYPVATESIYINTNQGILTFNTGYSVPGIPLAPRLAVTKTSEVVINGNQATINYTVTVTNTGNTDIIEVMLNDTINFNGSNITIGPITVDPATIVVDTSIPGVINLSGNLGPIAMGNNVVVTYSVPLENFSSPDTYQFNSVTSAMSAEAQASVDSTVSVEVVQFTVGNSCNITGDDSGQFFFTVSSVPNSPASQIRVLSSITIPSGIVAQFTSFGNCSATFNDDGQPVPLNTDITDRIIIVDCTTDIPNNGLMTFPVSLRVISVTTDGTILGRLFNVSLSVANSQVYLGYSPSFVDANINVDINSVCTTPC